MIKTVSLTGEEISVKNLGGFNTIVHNLGDETIYASKYPNISQGADNVAEIPSGAAKLISTTNGTVYLLGSGKAEVTGQDCDSVNLTAGGGTSAGVSKEYVDKEIDKVKGLIPTTLSENLSSKMDKENPTGTGALSLNRKANSAVGKNSVATGINTTASGWYTHAVGNGTTASGDCACSEGNGTTASGSGAHAEGLRTKASNQYSHSEGCETTADGKFSHAEGGGTKANGQSSHAEGYSTVVHADATGAHVEGGNSYAGGIYAHAEGYMTGANGDRTHAEGYTSNASGANSHAEGYATAAVGTNSHAECYYAETYGLHSHAEGYKTRTATLNTANETSGQHAEGGYTQAEGMTAHAQGWATLAKHDYSTACGSLTRTGCNNDFVTGYLNKPMENSLFTIGWGSRSGTLDMTQKPNDYNTDYYSYGAEGATLKNIFRVDRAGTVYGLNSYTTSGADYAEYIKPWADNNAENEDRRGYFVTIKNGKLHKAESDDYIVGITSGNPSVVGNGDEDWLGRWQRDEFNELIYKDVEVDDYAEKLNENGELVTVRVGSHIEKQTVQNPDYDPSQKYVERKDRSEWSCIGMIGVIPLRDDGTCVAGGFAKCGSGGVATKADSWDCHKTFFVIERINEHIISVEMR